MKIIILGNFLIILLISMNITSCRYSYLNKENSLIISDGACFDMPEEQVQRHNFLALLITFRETGWAIKNYDKETFTIVAEACRRSYCIEVLSFINSEGNVMIYRTSQEDISRNGKRVLARWINRIKKTYANYRCETYERLVQKSGIEF